MTRDFAMVGDEAGAPPSEGDAPNRMQSYGRRIFAGVAVVMAAAAVCFVLFGMHRGALPVTGAEPGADVIQENAQYPWGYDILENCGVDYKIKEVLHSNLGGYYQGPEGIIYRCSESINHKYIRDVKVWMNAITPYKSKSSHMNGISRDFGSIHIDAGEEVTLLVHLTDMDNKPFKASTFRMTFYDLDEAPHHLSQEYIIAEGHPDTLRDGKSSQIIREKIYGGIEFEATEQGSASDNPHDSSSLTQRQKDRSVVLTYHNVKEFHITLGSHYGHSPRVFEFALHSALSCQKGKVARTSTTTTTATTTTATTTTLDPEAAAAQQSQQTKNTLIAAGVVSAGTVGGVLFGMKKWKDGSEQREIAYFQGTS